MSFKCELDFVISEVKDIMIRDWWRVVNEVFLFVIFKILVDKGVVVNLWFSNLGNNNGGEGERVFNLSGSDSISVM